MRELIDLVNPAGLHIFSCRARTAFKLGHSCSVPVQTVLCLFAAISVFFCPWSDPWHQLWPWIWGYWQSLLPAHGSAQFAQPCRTAPTWWGHDLPWITLIALRQQLALATPWHQIFINGFLFSSFFFSWYPKAFFVHNSTGLFDSQLIVTLGACL